MTSLQSRHALESKALDHLWLHSNDLEWNELVDGGLRVFVEGRGSTLIDVNGKQYIDGLAGLFVVAIGHGRTEIAEAMAAQAGKLAYTAASNAANPAAIALAEKISSLTLAIWIGSSCAQAAPKRSRAR